MNPAELPLRDIHLPAEPGWWPLAPGWWLVAGAVLVAVAVAAWLANRRRTALSRLAARRVTALERQWRDNGDPRALLGGLSATLRQCAIAVSGRDAAAGLVGEPWREHLNAPLPDRPFDAAPGNLLLDAAYRAEVPALDAADVEALVTLCRRWPRAAQRRVAP